MHLIAAKAVAFKEALQPDFKAYQQHVVSNARAMAKVLQQRGYKVVSGGTDNHMMLIDFSSKPYTGKDVDAALASAYIFAEMARFNYGSTVIVLPPPGVVQLVAGLDADQWVRLGQALAW